MLVTRGKNLENRLEKILAVVAGDDLSFSEDYSSEDEGGGIHAYLGECSLAM